MTWAAAQTQATLKDAPPLRFSDRADGISCGFRDVALGLAWPAGKPGWLDAIGRSGGEAPLARLHVPAGSASRVLRLDLSAFVRSTWLQAGQPDINLLVRVTGDALRVHAREDADPTLRPQLLLRFDSGAARLVDPAADAALDCSTYKGLGTQPVLTGLAHAPLALRFAVDRLRSQHAAPPVSAELVLVRAPEGGSGAVDLSVFELAFASNASSLRAPAGLARNYPGDRGIERDPDVLFADGFDAGQPSARWTVGMKAPTRVLSEDRAHGFAPLNGPALGVTIRRGEQVGADLHLRFKSLGIDEPQEAFFRYYVRFAQSWLLTSDGGKLPGFAGTYGEAGWGGRAWDGSKGWSLRGSYGLPPPAGHPAAGHFMIGTYAYHGAAQGSFGEILPWDASAVAGLVMPDRWYCVEQQVRLNTPGRSDGLLRAWVDGRLALERSDLRLRNLAGIRIEDVWLNVFHGGTAVATADMHLYIDQVVIARRYVGPMAP